jgi:hypothetical protein
MGDKPQWSSRLRPWLWLLLLLAGIELTYVGIVTAGSFRYWPTWNFRFDALAEGFRSGHLYIPIKPHPELVAAADPFDPVNKRLWLWDASLHEGHYYFYWGPLPAVVIAIVKTVFRLKVTIGDQFPSFVFHTMYLLAGALLIVRMTARLFENPPRWLQVLSILVFAYANPTPYMVASPDTYQAAIMGAQAFLLIGVLLAFEACWLHGDDSERRKRKLLIWAGVTWGLAFMTRASSSIPTAALIIATALAAAPPTPWRVNWRRPIRPGVWMATPMAAAVVLHLVYNKARFGSLFDFGVTKQLAIMRFKTGLAYVWPNLYSYLLRPITVSCKFPYLGAPAGPEERVFPGWELPAGYMAPEPVAGALTAMPWIWLVPVAAVLVVLGGRAARRTPAAFWGDDRRARMHLYCGVAFLVLASLTGLPVIAEFFATMRFMSDVTGGLVLAGIWATWTVYARLRERPRARRAFTAVVVSLAVVTIVIGVLFGFQGYDQMFARWNPHLWRRLVSALSAC